MDKKYRFEVEWVEEGLSESFDLLVQSSNLDNEQKDTLKKTVFDWAAEGIEKGFGNDGHVHYISNKAKWETINGKDYFDVYIDLGTANETALDVLLDRLDSAKMPIEKVYLGKNTLDIKEQEQ